MRKFLLASILMLLALGLTFADGSIVTTNDKSIELKTLQSGDVIIITDVSRLALTPKVRNEFVDYLKAHLECMNKFSEEKITISNTTETGRMPLGYISQYRFVLMTNEIDKTPYILSLRFYENNDRIASYTFDAIKLQEFINILEGTKTNTDDVIKQNRRVKELTTNIRNSMY